MATLTVVSRGAGQWSLVSALLTLAPLAELAELHQAAHDLTQLHSPAVPPEHLSEVSANIRIISFVIIIIVSGRIIKDTHLHCHCIWYVILYL